MINGVLRGLAAVAVALLVAAGCGDDDGGDDVAAYCDFSAQLDAADETPSDEDLDRIAELAPSEISDEVQTVVDEFKASGEEAFVDESVVEAFETIEAYEAENCDEASGVDVTEE